MIQTVGDTVLELTLKLTCWQKPAGLDSRIQVLLTLASPDHNWFHMMHIKRMLLFFLFFLFAHTNVYYVSHHFINYAVQFRMNFWCFLFHCNEVFFDPVTPKFCEVNNKLVFLKPTKHLYGIVFRLNVFFLPLHKTINKSKL